MDAKKAIEILKWIRLQCDYNLKKEIDRTIKYIESQKSDAELGRAAVEAIKNQCPFVGKYDIMSKTCKRCILKDYCRLRAGKGGE